MSRVSVVRGGGGGYRGEGERGREPAGWAGERARERAVVAYGVKAGDQEDGEGDEQGHVDTYEIDLSRVGGAGGTREEGGG